MSTTVDILPAAAFAALPLDSPFHLAARLAAFPACALGASPGRGRGLFAARSFAPGEVILREPAALWQCGGALFTAPGALASLDALLLQAAPYALTPATAAASTLRVPRAAAQAAVLDHNAYSIVGCAAAAAASEQAPAAPAGESAEEEEEEEDARALFPVIALANSACNGNAAAGQAAPGGADAAAHGGLPVSLLTARRAISAGEEIFTCYVPRAWPKAQRAAALAQSYGFTCTCARCTCAWDDTVALKCAACAQGRIFWPDAGVAQAACGGCGGAVSAGALPAAAAPGAPLDFQLLELLAWEEVGEEEALVERLQRAAQALLGHPALSVSDARVFEALTRVMDVAGEVEGAGGRAASAAAALGAQCAQALLEAVQGCGFACMAELGFEVEEG